jgi:hypothetical protein
LKVIEALLFARSVVSGEQGVPGFKEALCVAEVQTAMAKSWESGGMEAIVPIRP